VYAAANNALKLTRLSACQRGGSGSAENAALHWLCPSSAVQLKAGVDMTFGVKSGWGCGVLGSPSSRSLSLGG